MRDTLLRWTTGWAILVLLALGAAGLQPIPALAGETTTLRIASSAKELAARNRAVAKVRKRALGSARKVLGREPGRLAVVSPEGVDLDAPRTIEFPLRGGGTGSAVLDPIRFGIESIGRAVDVARDRGSLLALYTALHRRIPSAYLAGLATPLELAALPAAKVRKGMISLGETILRDFVPIRRDLSQTVPGLLVVNPIGDCEAEAGWESIPYPAESSNRCETSEYAAGGIVRNVDFALERALTCIKDQGSRGTCTAHAVVAGVETAAMAGGGPAENLSEQSAHFFGKIAPDWSTRYLAGVDLALALHAMRDGDYRFVPERDWNYNQSPGIDPLDPVTNQRPDSCDGTVVPYAGEMCTDFEFQAVENLQFVAGVPTLVEYEFPASTPNTGHRVTSVSEIADFDIPPGGPFAALQLEMVALLVEAETPVAATVLVPPAFDSPDADGYVRPVPGEVSRGSHAILIVGFVANEDLPAGVAPDTGPIGGFFVAKNSWRTTWGDCGLVYLSSAFLDTYGTAYVALGID